LNTEQDTHSVIFNTGAFKFSGINIDSLQSTQYTLVGLAIDSSMSISNFAPQMTKAVKEVVRSLQNAPNSDNLMLRVLNFDRTTNEVHGFQEWNKCDLTQYDKIFTKFGCSTCLYDATIDALDSLNKYGMELVNQDYSPVNALLVVLTDGLDNNSTFTFKDVVRKMKEGVGEKKLESMLSILIGVNIHDPQVGIELNNFKRESEFDSYIEIDNVTEKSVARLANFISKSISSQSSSLGGGSKSQTITF